MKRKLTRLPLEELRTEYQRSAQAIRNRLKEFKQVPPSEYFYEIVYCILTPQSSAANAERAVRLLREHNLAGADIDPEPLLHQDEFYIRFHKTKAQFLLDLKAQYPEVLRRLRNGSESRDLRVWLLDNIGGFGWKEASHFLRNIGHEGLAILDRHILKNLIRTGVLRALPPTLTPKRYLSIERKFHKFALQIDIPMDELDLLFWSMETGEIRK